MDKFNFHEELREVLWWIPTVGYVKPMVAENLHRKGNRRDDDHLNDSDAFKDRYFNEQPNLNFAESLQAQTEEDTDSLTEMIEKRLASFVDGTWVPSPALERLLSICLWRMMPEHPCQLQKSQPVGVFHLKEIYPPWSVTHLVMGLLTFLHYSVSDLEKGSESMILDILLVTLKVIMYLEDSSDQNMVMNSVASCDRYPDLVSKLCLSEPLHEICCKGLIPPLNKVMELGEIDNGAIMDEEEEDKRLASMGCWFLPYIMLFPTISLKQIIQSAVANRGQFSILRKLVCKWRPFLHFRSPSNSVSNLIRALQLVVLDSGGILGSDVSITLLAEVISKSSKDWGASALEVVRDVIIRFLRKYACGEDIPVESLLLAAGSIYQSIGQTSLSIDDRVELLHCAIDLIDILCNILTVRPQALQWSCTVPQFFPMKIIELGDSILAILLRDLHSIGVSENSEVWHCFLENSKKLAWPVQAKLVSVLDDLKQKGFLTSVDRIVLPDSFEGDFSAEKDPYAWAKIVEDAFIGLTSCMSLSEMLVASYSNQDVNANSEPRGNVGFISEKVALMLKNCPSHLFPWCAVVSIARILPFMTSRECAMLFTKGLEGVLTCYCPGLGHILWPAEFQVQSPGFHQACLIIELVCRSIYFLAAHEDVMVVDRQAAVSCALRRLNEIGEDLLDTMNGDAAALELASGRWFKEICGLLAAIQEHYPCDVIQVRFTANLSPRSQGAAWAWSSSCHRHTATTKAIRSLSIPIKP